MADLNEPALVIIGSGASGGTIAEVLTARGLPVVLLEAGPRIEPGEFHQDDLKAFGQLSWLEPRVSSGSWSATALTPDRPAWVVRALGGTTLHWNGLAYRPQAHGAEGPQHLWQHRRATLADWPLSLADLAPFHARRGTNGGDRPPASRPTRRVPTTSCSGTGRGGSATRGSPTLASPSTAPTATAGPPASSSASATEVA